VEGRLGSEKEKLGDGKIKRWVKGQIGPCNCVCGGGGGGCKRRLEGLTGPVKTWDKGRDGSGKTMGGGG
jgi:hypothetical protein